MDFFGLAKYLDLLQYLYSILVSFVRLLEKYPGINKMASDVDTDDEELVDNVVAEGNAIFSTQDFIGSALSEGSKTQYKYKIAKFKRYLQIEFPHVLSDVEIILPMKAFSFSLCVVYSHSIYL